MGIREAVEGNFHVHKRATDSLCQNLEVSKRLLRCKKNKTPKWICRYEVFRSISEALVRVGDWISIFSGTGKIVHFEDLEVFAASYPPCEELGQLFPMDRWDSSQNNREKDITSTPIQMEPGPRAYPADLEIPKRDHTVGNTDPIRSDLSVVTCHVTIPTPHSRAYVRPEDDAVVASKHVSITLHHLKQ
uniref:Uncharacterized protein n=1 Tax=Timema cristinae TaxID=61476 RepID=A0A7R9H202_TIMCR|nr:unnamed protein product [Timema cristinae]